MTHNFRLGEIAFFRGIPDPVTIIEAVQIWDGTDGTVPGYRVMMEGWSAPQETPVRTLQTYEQNMEIMEQRVHAASFGVEHAVSGWVHARKNLAALKAWGEKHL